MLDIFVILSCITISVIEPAVKAQSSILLTVLGINTLFTPSLSKASEAIVLIGILLTLSGITTFSLFPTYFFNTVPSVTNSFEGVTFSHTQ